VTAEERPLPPPLGPLRSTLGRALDVVGSLVLLLLAAPLIVVGAALVYANGGRPLFFGHVRVGKDGRLFRCWKLRTMHRDAEARLHADPALYHRYVENGYKLPDAEDPRLIQGGRWLRSRYLDELPQLWNVLKGDMSLVGWRPVVPGEMDLFGEHAPTLLLRKPGLFGEWTSRGRRRPPYPERVSVEVELVRDPTLGRTARILGRSVAAVLAGMGEER
jgi:lipopolysaccharide/colanic/teichoic acid biosynthesis glycosyltransferase